ncbi:hypothetical protein FORMB_18850 [Formosa sp. Hel1_33_131]|uniref:hypothetical protein n=1 Tax=Formosa sp. Hel1_33_131 TaxID=1336794 RepID=UPI00084E35B9|nr:hypothetical protein [Formosa sp. Hel1_33_131]AOR28915.1 hypothetical protein FORMB_18850 [Formosa sp. Hel1_33_131]
MAIFKSVSDSHFELDGVLYPKIYDVKKESTTISLFNVHSEKWLNGGSFHISDITIETLVRADFATEILFLNELKKTVFKKGGGNGMGLQGSNTLYFDDATYVYISGLRSNGDWYVNRNTIADNTQTTATETNNGGQTTQPLTLVICQGLSYS